MLLPTGISSLDRILGGGLPTGSIAVIEEDLNGSYSKVLLKYFLAEGIVENDSIFLLSQDVNPVTIVNDLPAVIKQEDTSNIRQKRSETEELKIAFRYQNLPTSDLSQLELQPSHNYDMSKTMPAETVEKADITCWSNLNGIDYSNVFNAINDKIQVLKTKSKKSLRICIHSFGSPMWLDSLNKDCTRNLNLFMFTLRAILKQENAVALISIPTYLYTDIFFDRCIHSSDVAMRLQSFYGTELENNPSLADFHGFFYLTKLAPINSLASKHQGSVEYAFKLRRKKFNIEVLHLPPDVQDKTQDVDPSSSSMHGCMGPNKHLLEF